MADLGFGRDFDTQDTGDGSHMVNSNLVACLSYIVARVLVRAGINWFSFRANFGRKAAIRIVILTKA
jgi:hypothetical protein